MKISLKSRYGLVSMMHLAEFYGDKKYISLISIAEKYEISKIYLEQVFSPIKASELVVSVKGPKGGYMLSKSPDKISVYNILMAIEPSIFQKPDEPFTKKSIEIENIIKTQVLDKINDNLENLLTNISLLDLINNYDTFKENASYMNFI